MPAPVAFASLRPTACAEHVRFSGHRCVGVGRGGETIDGLTETRRDVHEYRTEPLMHMR